MNSQKRVGILIRDERTNEGLRMSGALTLCDDYVEVFLFGHELEVSEEVAIHLDTLEMCEIPIFASFNDDRVQELSLTELSKRLLTYDTIITF